jgi:hypothetical protein
VLSSYVVRANDEGCAGPDGVPPPGQHDRLPRVFLPYRYVATSPHLHCTVKKATTNSMSCTVGGGQTKISGSWKIPLFLILRSMEFLKFSDRPFYKYGLELNGNV